MEVLAKMVDLYSHFNLILAHKDLLDFITVIIAQ